MQTERRADRMGEDDGASNRANARREHLIIELFSFSDHEGELLGFDGIGGETSTDSIERGGIERELIAERGLRVFDGGCCKAR